MNVQATFVFAKRRIPRLMPLHPVAYLISQLQMLARAAIKLVREGSEEAVSVAKSGGRVEAKRPELVVEEGSVLQRVGGELDVCVAVFGVIRDVDL